MGRDSRIVKVIMVIAIIACISGLISIHKKWKYPGDFEIHTIDVEKGTLLLIKNNGKIILVGGAEEEDAEKINDYLKTQGISRIDTAIWYQPTKNYTGGYSELVHNIPINKLWIYQPERIDLASNNLARKLKHAGCEVKSISLEDTYKGRDNNLRIAVTLLRDKKVSENTQVVIEIKAPRLNYVWIPDNNKVSIASKTDFKKQFTPDILNISGGYRMDLLQQNLFNYKKIKLIIVGDRGKINRAETEKINEIGVETLEKSKEGQIIVYRNNNKYHWTSWRQLKINVF